MTSGCCGKFVYQIYELSMFHYISDMSCYRLTCLKPTDTCIFSTHFFSTLRDEGVDAVARWTKKKNINIFEKKMIFIPVHKDLHWSLCVVCNPNQIMHNLTDQSIDQPTSPYTCLLFFDSLKIHTRKKLSPTIIKWLNSEWKRLKPKEKIIMPFNDTTMKSYSPIGNYCMYCKFFIANDLHTNMLQFPCNETAGTAEYMCANTLLHYITCLYQLILLELMQSTISNALPIMHSSNSIAMTFIP